MKVGNILIVDITICNMRFTLVNLYGPNTEDPNFYQLIVQKVKLFNNKYCLFGSDGFSVEF